MNRSFTGRVVYSACVLSVLSLLLLRLLSVPPTNRLTTSPAMTPPDRNECNPQRTDGRFFVSSPSPLISNMENASLRSATSSSDKSLSAADIVSFLGHYFLLSSIAKQGRMVRMIELHNTQKRTVQKGVCWLLVAATTQR